MCKNFLLVILLGLPISANAHSLLTSSYPQSGEILTVPPTEIVMEFRTPTRLIKVDLTKSSDKKGKRLLGGFIGVLIVGFKRAAFSNEAGAGSAAIAHSAVKTKYPASEGVVAATVTPP